VPTWTQIVNDTFVHAGTTPGGAGSTTGLPTSPSPGVANGWTDYHGSVWQIGSSVANTAVGTDVGGSHRPTGQLNAALRLTSSEQSVDQRVIVDFDIIDSNQLEPMLVGRYVATGKCYAVNILQSAGNGFIRVWIPDGSNNSANPAFTSGSLGAFNAAHNHRLQVDFVGANPTTITATWTDLTANTVMGSATTTDSTTALQAAGAAGMCVADGATSIITRFQLFTGAVSAGTVTVTGATKTTISLSATAPSGGLAPLTNSWYRSTTSNFTPGAGNVIGGATGLTLTDTPGGSPGDVFYYKVGATDSSAVPVTSYSITTPAATLKAGPVIGLYGDSLTALYTSSPTTFPAAWAQLLPDYSLATSVYGVNGADTSILAQGGASWNAMKAQFAGAGVTLVVIRVGSNDSNSSYYTSAATYLARLTAMVNDLVAAGYLVQLDEPPCPKSGSFGVYTDQSASFCQAYSAQLDTLVDNVKVFKGDRRAFRWLADNPGKSTDGVHPTDPTDLARFTIEATARNLGYLGAIGGGGGYSRSRAVGGA
jgi:hypothetical protein